MTCDEYQNLVVAGGDPAGHVCPECAAFVEALCEIDARLTREYAGIRAAPDFNQTVIARIPDRSQLICPTPVPEVLEAIAWSGTGAAAAGGLWLLAPAHANMQLLIVIAAVLVFLGAAWSSARCFAELRS